MFFGNLIKAAASRQREFLADASAVQFTRQTEGMVGALHKIAVLPRQRLHSWHAAEYAHFMFGSIHEPDIFDKLAATHPATIERIRRLSPFRARQLADEIDHAAAGGMQYEGWLGFAQVRREASWADAEAEALENEHEARAAAMRRRIEAFRPGAATRSAAWQRTAPRARRSSHSTRLASESVPSAQPQWFWQAQASSKERRLPVILALSSISARTPNIPPPSSRKTAT